MGTVYTSPSCFQVILNFVSLLNFEHKSHLSSIFPQITLCSYTTHILTKLYFIYFLVVFFPPLEYL